MINKENLSINGNINQSWFGTCLINYGSMQVPEVNHEHANDQ